MDVHHGLTSTDEPSARSTARRGLVLGPGFLPPAHQRPPEEDGQGLYDRLISRKPRLVEFVTVVSRVGNHLLTLGPKAASCRSRP
ncbi:hypothetical protein ABZ490_13920 [Streptomyces sp. NPDC005811]|uniref:hypothetical protein n=1 Tax=Streptomyces sp. NPDC005811 TaxID=3154565 RepID=UPI0033DDA18D